METDKHYFIVGLFIIGLSLFAALFSIWLTGAGHRDDVLYRIHFSESVSGLAVGDPVKFRGVDVGTVKTMVIDPGDPRLVQVEVKLRKETPVKTDTRASLNLKGITGVVFVELNAKSLLEATPNDQIPEIPSEKTGLKAMLEQLPKMVDKFSSLEDQIKKVVTDVGALTSKVKDNPSLLLKAPKEPVSQGK
jgi:phospholipid/cholesterol/gamma-HCH transport system substrate-binding protein